MMGLGPQWERIYKQAPLPAHPSVMIATLPLGQRWEHSELVQRGTMGCQLSLAKVPQLTVQPGCTVYRIWLTEQGEHEMSLLSPSFARALQRRRLQGDTGAPGEWADAWA